jgi:hypothetical protein
VTWTLNTTFREDCRTALLAALNAWRTANPTLLRKTWPVRPDSYTLGDFPSAAIGDLSESIANSQGIRTRTMTGFSLELVDRVPDNAEAALRMDLLVDAMLDYFNDPHLISGTTVIQPVAVDDVRGVSEATNLQWYGNVISFATNKMEGRP